MVEDDNTTQNLRLLLFPWILYANTCNMNADANAFLMNVIRRLNVGQSVVLIEEE